MPIGRPSTYSDEIAEAICERMARGRSLRSVCDDDDMPAMGTVFRWLHAQPSFREQYARAREAQAIADAERIDEAALTLLDAGGSGEITHERIGAYRTAIDALKWSAARKHPRVYGDKVSAELSGPGGGPITVGWKEGA